MLLWLAVMNLMIVRAANRGCSDIGFSNLANHQLWRRIDLVV